MKYWRHHRIRGWREYAAFAAFILTSMICGFFLLGFSLLRSSPQTLGVTFSDKYAQSLGLDSAEALRAIVDDLGVHDVRIPVYWSDVEVAQGQFDFSRIDRLLDIAADHDISVTLAIGMKVPRWPECYIPSFYDSNVQGFDGQVLRYMQALVSHTRQYDVITRWQVENEPFFSYGECPEPSLSRLRQEVALVRALDSRPIMMTVSGEQELWFNVASLSDSIGVSLYRFAHQDILGPVAFPNTPFYYRVHAFVARFFTDDIVISELQMEPWFTGNPQESGSIDVNFSADDFREHLQFAKETGIHEALLWGVEWWYYEHLQGDDSLWNVAKDAFAQDSAK
ncbi:MAG: hypothetical protein WC776_01485 [Patescibacteria group bacterium]